MRRRTVRGGGERDNGRVQFLTPKANQIATLVKLGEKSQEAADARLQRMPREGDKLVR